MEFNTYDRNILRGLAKEVAEIAADPVMAKRKQMWVEHNGLHSTYPMMLVFPEGCLGGALANVGDAVPGPQGPRN